MPDGPERWNTVIPIIEELKVKAKKLGLWNLFLSKAHYPKHGVPLTNLEVRLSYVMNYPALTGSSTHSWLRCWAEAGIWRQRLSTVPLLIQEIWVSLLKWVQFKY